MDLMTENEIVRLQHLLEISQKAAIHHAERIKQYEKKLGEYRSLVDAVFGMSCMDCQCTTLHYKVVCCSLIPISGLQNNESGSITVLPVIDRNTRREDCPYNKILNEFPASRRDV